MWLVFAIFTGSLKMINNALNCISDKPLIDIGNE